MQSDSGMPCSANSSFRMEIVLAALHRDGGILRTKGNLRVVFNDNEVLIAIKVHEVSTKVLPWAFRGWGWLEWLSRLLWAMVLAHGTCFNGVFDVLVDTRPIDTLAGMILALGYS